jgi:hypothetical protein
MPVPSLVTDLSTTLASNSPAGSDNVFPDLDNYIRALSGFLASIRDNSGNGWVSPYLTAANPSYTGTLTGGTGIVNLGSGQFYKSATGDVGIGTSSPGYKLTVTGASPTIVASDTGANTTRAYVSATNAQVSYGATYSTSAVPIVFGLGLSSGIPTTEWARFDASGNLLLGVSAAGTSAAKVIGLANATAPTTSPAGMGQLYVEGGALKFRGSSGTVTTIAPA